MATLLVFLGLLISLLTPLNASLVHMSDTIHRLSELDRMLAEKSDQISTVLNRALALNTPLRALHLACPAATESGTIAALKQKAEIIRRKQEQLLWQAKALLFSVGPGEFDTEMNPPLRGPVGPCTLPDLLRCLSETGFVMKHREARYPGGTEGRIQNCRFVTWSYRDERVRAFL